MALQGAEILSYPTTIGSEPQDEGLDSRDHWRRVMQGHAGANLVCPVIDRMAYVVYIEQTFCQSTCNNIHVEMDIYESTQYWSIKNLSCADL